MMNCLIVSGDREARDLIKVGLEQTGVFEVETAEDGWGFEAVKTKPFRVVVVDTALADGGDGIELLRRVREAQPQSELLLVSRDKGDGRPQGRDKQAFGVYAFIPFPIDATEFFKTIARLVDRLNAGAAVAA
jgi:DNA-binding NtrC family response regulator